MPPAIWALQQYCIIYNQRRSDIYLQSIAASSVILFRFIFILHRNVQSEADE